MTAATRRQRVIVEFHDGDWFVMLDAGDVQIVGTPGEALAIVQRAAKRGNKAITITNVEWRNAPAGFVPPTGGQS